jgi:hypothetical protein
MTRIRGILATAALVLLFHSLPATAAQKTENPFPRFEPVAKTAHTIILDVIYHPGKDKLSTHNPIYYPRRDHLKVTNPVFYPKKDRTKVRHLSL